MVASDIFNTSLLVYGLPLAAMVLGYAGLRRRHETIVRTTHAEHIEAGLVEPPSLHPLIDPLRCIGCSACIKACPEKGVLGLIDEKAHLVAPTQCIGHGACRIACPEHAIELVFGTERRGVDIPHVAENYETNVSGIFIAGELGGMGLIRNAVKQGSEAMASVATHLGTRPKNLQAVDVVIVGAGPAGLAAGLAAMERGLTYLILEQESLGGTVAHYPRGKIIMTAPMDVPLIGRVKITETTKEALLDFWQYAIDRTGLEVMTGHQVRSIHRKSDTFEIATDSQIVDAKSVLLAIGRRGTPRKLGVRGEEMSKVVYRLVNSEQYRGREVLVVGGGDSALEAALALSREPGTRVALSYRSESFSRARPKNRRSVEDVSREGGIDLYLSSTVTSIDADSVSLESTEGPISLRNDAVIVCAGGVLPAALLLDAGIEVEKKFGTA